MVASAQEQVSRTAASTNACAEEVIFESLIKHLRQFKLTDLCIPLLTSIPVAVMGTAFRSQAACRPKRC